ncbi:MAG: hypothetical protein GX282_07145 [Campylobacteraceae bacterium]|nr:hypothetical protein [Campylobacteraceae bacterium]
MRVLKFLGVLVVLFLITVYVVAFTGFGNNLVKPYIEKTAKEKTGYDVKLSKFDLKLGKVDIIASINDEINANLKGNYWLFSQSFDLSYELDIKNLKSFGVELDEPMGLAGQVRGKAKDFGVNGVGKLLDSDVRFLASIKEFKPFNVDLDAKGLNLTKALALANQPAFVSGHLDALANIKNGVGTANISSKDAVISKNGLKDINITIPENIALGLNSDIVFENNVVTANSKIESKLGNLEALKTIYNLNSKELESDFNLDILNLANLEPFTKQKLAGSLKADGFVKIAENKLKFVDFNLNGFGGEVKTHLENSVLSADINSIEISEILGVIAMPKAVFGVVDGKVKIDDINNLDNIKGNAILSVKDGKVEPSGFKKLTNLEFPKDNSFSLNSDTKIENGVVNSSSSLISNLFKVEKVDAVYDLKSKNLKADFIANVDDLAKLKEFTKKTLKGDLKANGSVAMANNALTSLNLDIKTLGGAITANSNGKNLNAKVANLNLDDIFGLIGQNALASGLITADVALSSIDVKNLNGTAKLSLANSVLNEKELSKMLNKEFPKGVKLKADADINIASSVASFVTKIDSDLANLTKFDGSFNINSGALKADYEALVNDLSKLAFATGKKMNGSLKANGNIDKKADNLVINLYSDLFNGNFKANLTNENLVATFDKFQILELTRMLDFGEFYKGIGDLDFKYNINNKLGNFNLDINEGQLTKSEFTNVVSLLTQRDITKEIFNNSWVKGTINNELINFNAHLKAPKMEVNATSASLNTKTSKINIPVAINIEKTDLSGTITGTTSKPKVDIKSNYLEQKLDKALGKGLDKLLGTQKDGNSTEPATIDGAIDRGLDKLLGGGKKSSGQESGANLDANASTQPSSDEIIKDEVKNLLKGFF